MLPKVKIITVGKVGVGKTCLVITYIKGSFPRDSDSTIGAAQNSKKLKIDDKMIDLQIWDTAGAERYKALLPMYSRGAHVALICFENPDLKIIEDHVCTVKKDAPDIHIILVATKVDSDFEYAHEDVEEYAKTHGYDSICTSSLKNKNVTETFELAAKKGLELVESLNQNDKLSQFNVNIIEVPQPTSQSCCGMR